MYFPSDFSCLFIIGKKRKKTRVVHVALSLAATWGLTETRQKCICEALVDNSWQLFCEENSESFKTFSSIIKGLCWVDSTQMSQGSISEKCSLSLAFWLQNWTLQPPGPGVSLLLFLGGRFHLPPYLFCSVPLVGLCCLTSICYSLHASSHSQQTPLLNYSDSEVALLVWLCWIRYPVGQSSWSEEFRCKDDKCVVNT